VPRKLHINNIKNKSMPRFFKYFNKKTGQTPSKCIKILENSGKTRPNA
jgi:hypothetical protein